MLTNRKIGRARARDLQLVSHILLAVQALSLGHLLASRHITCPEHGDIMHVESSVGTPSDRSTADATPRAALTPTEATAGAEHHHCLVCAETNRRGLLAGSAQACVAPALIANEAYRPSPAGFAPIELLLLSPKNSPPSA